MDRPKHALFPRFTAEIVTTALRDTPVVMITGPRQSGKTTLVRNLVARDREFITMDDDTVLAADDVSNMGVQAFKPVQWKFSSGIEIRSGSLLLSADQAILPLHHSNRFA